MVFLASAKDKYCKFLVQFKFVILMKSLFEAEARQEILHRINSLKSSTKPQWGKMNVNQMLKHCHGPIKVAMGTKQLDVNLGFMKKLVFKLFKSS